MQDLTGLVEHDGRSVAVMKRWWMRFIELTGTQLLDVVTEGELDMEELRAAGVHSGSLLRVNEQGDVEIRRPERWDVVGGLLGNFDQRLRDVTGLDWA
jgi:hypothetical protein